MEDLTQSLNEFGIDLFKSFYSESIDGNLNKLIKFLKIYLLGPGSTVISSVSVFIALMIALAGSRDETKNEILKALRIQNIYEDEKTLNFHQKINSLTKLIVSNESSNNLLIANRMIINNLNLKNSFETIIKTSYESEIDKVSTEKSLETIIIETNKWISQLTDNKITAILDESFKSVALTILNAIYFKCEWLNPFDSRKTQIMDFHMTKTSKQSLEMMQLSNKKLLYYFSQNLEYHLLSLPYNQEKYYFNIILPSEDDFLISKNQQSLINHLDYNQIKTDMQNLSPTLIDLFMPKFVSKKKINLNQILKNMGITNAFDSLKANFYDISDTNIFVQEVINKIKNYVKIIN